MGLGLTEAQKNRLVELGIADPFSESSFETEVQRQGAFHAAERQGVRENKEKLHHLLRHTRKVSLCRLEEELATALCGRGFTQVATPTLISARALEKMSINREHPLYGQVFRVDKKTCLRPMLAPGLYEVSRQLMASQGLPLRLFEIGSCFRRESEGRSHLEEFTMLNLVEWGTAPEEREEVLRELASFVMETAGIVEYHFEQEDSAVYGPGLDVVGEGGLELASSSMGPHRLDAAWKISCPWVGIGLGLERLLLYREGGQGIHRYGRSAMFLDGACLKLK